MRTLFTKSLSSAIATSITAAILVLLLCSMPAAAVDVAPMPYVKLQFFDNDGAPAAGGCLFTYQAGTTTPQSTYSDSTGTSVNTNPVILDASGRASVWFSANTYKLVMKSFGGLNCASGTTLWTMDNVSERGLMTYTQAVLLNPAGGAQQTVAGSIKATYFEGSTAHTTSPGVRVALIAADTIRDTATNPPTDHTVAPALASQIYNVPDPGTGGNYVINPSGNAGTANGLDCTLTGISCKKYAFYNFPGGICNNTTAAMGFDTFGSNSPSPICVTGTNVQKGVLALPSAATLYQQNTNSAAAAGTCTVTYPQATIAGDQLIGVVVVDGGRTVTGVTDGTNAYTSAKEQANGNTRLAVWYFNGSSTAMAAASTLTFTFSGAGNSACAFYAYKDLKTSTVLDVTASNTGATTAVTTGTTAGTAQNTELVFAAVGSPSNPSVTPGTGVVGHTTVSQSTNVTLGSSGLIQQATSTQAGTFTLGSAQNWASVIVTFKANVGNLTAGQRAFQLPQTYVSTIAQTPFIKWQAPLLPTGTVNVRLGAAVACAADGSTDDPAFNTPSYATTAVNASSTGIITQTAPGNLTITGCAAANTEHLQVIRNRYDSNDTYEGYVYVNSVGLQLGIQ